MNNFIERTAGTRSTAGRLDERFRRGLRCFEVDDWSAALVYFRAVDQQAAPDDPRATLFSSYHGLTLVCLGDRTGLRLCRQAAASELRQAGVYHNLAQAELRLGHRRQAWQAVQRGLQIEPQHRGLQRQRQRMGVRRRPTLPFLKRDNPLNRWLGKLTWRMQHPGHVVH